MLWSWGASQRAKASPRSGQTAGHTRNNARPGPDASPHGRPQELTAELALVRSVSAVILAVTQLVGGQADGGVVGTGVGGRPAGQGLTVLLVRVIFAVAVTVAHPRFADAPSWGMGRGQHLGARPGNWDSLGPAQTPVDWSNRVIAEVPWSPR